MALKMLRHGKLKILPSIARAPRNGKQPASLDHDLISDYPEPVAKPKAAATAAAGTIGYYPGCSLHVTGIEYHLSTEAVMEKLGLKLVEPKGWVCCGTSPAHNTNHYRSVKLPMQTLALAKQQGMSYLTMPCAACFSRFRIAMHEVEHDPELRAQIGKDKDIGHEYTGGVQVDSLLTTITDRVGYEAAARPIVKPLNGLKVACYYGCLLTRPPEVTGEEHFEYPTNMDQLMKEMGAEPLDWGYKTDCCGGSLWLSTLDIALDLSHKILKNAKEVGADLIVTACPLCHINLDARQKQINDVYPDDSCIPVVYFTQLMGVAYGIEPKALGLQKHFSDGMGVLRSRNLLGA
jgi:heterodisulfide reductase subunit B